MTVKRKMINSFILITGLLFNNGYLQAQDSTRNFSNPFSFQVAYQRLRSTHATIFHGISADGCYSLSSHFIVGIGMQYAATPLHNDNNWVLTRLRLLPLYTSQVYRPLPSHRIQPYIHTEEGISFNHYNKLDTAIAPMPYRVSEKGLYLSGNAGADIVLLKHLRLFTEIGYKGFKHSANDLDVNPHGLTTRIGIAL